MHVCICMTYVSMEVRSRHQIPWTWSFELPCTWWVLEIESRSSGRMPIRLFGFSRVFLVSVEGIQLKPGVSKKGHWRTQPGFMCSVSRYLDRGVQNLSLSLSFLLSMLTPLYSPDCCGPFCDAQVAFELLAYLLPTPESWLLPSSGSLLLSSCSVLSLHQSLC